MQDSVERILAAGRHLLALINELIDIARIESGTPAAGTPVAILSAEASPASIRQMRARGVIAYLIKPLDLTELGQLPDSLVAEHDHEADPAPRTVPAP
jgi:AmiR/NasT family two-component response regulator